MQFAHGGLGDSLEFFAQKIGAEGIAFLGTQFFLGGLLEMGGLGGDEKGIELGFQIRRKKREVGSEAQKTEKVEGFF